MVKNVGLKESLYTRLKKEKGDRSFSWIIEQYINAKPVHPSAKTNVQAADTPQGAST